MSETIDLARDEIRLFLPGISDEEHERRAKLRGFRNAATAMIASTDCDNARALAWMVNDYATEALFCPAAAEALDDLNQLCRRLMLTAIQAEQMNDARMAA